MNNEDMSMADFMDEIEKSMKSVKPGEVMNGTVVSVTEEEVVVNLGAAADGVIPREEVSDFLVGPISDLMKPGDEIEVYVMKTNDGTGNILLSMKRAARMTAWDTLEDSLQNGTLIKIKPSEVVKGGLVSDWNGIRLFMPASQTSGGGPVNLDDCVGVVMEVKVTEADRATKKAVVSRRAVEEVEMKAGRERMMDSLKIGDRMDGRVTRLADFGAFVDIGGTEGLLHISELSWKRILKPSEVVNVGDNVEVSILDLNKETGRISLKLTNITGDPWGSIENSVRVGEVMVGKISRIKPFGAFVELLDGVEGLVHISQIADERINSPTERVKVGQEVAVKVLEVNSTEKRISLSIKEAKEADVPDYEDYMEDDADEPVTLGDLFKDKLGKLKF